MWSFISNLFSADKAVDTITKIVDKVAGTDWTPKDRAEFALQYMEATKHQSPARRALAIGVGAVWIFFALFWLFATTAGHVLSVPFALDLAKDIEEYALSTIGEPFNYVIMFYFGIAGLQAIRK